MPDPEKLGRYDVLGVLGKGAMGVVYKGYDPVIERLVAIKTVLKELTDSPFGSQAVERFKNEAKAAGRLGHPNIVGVYEYGEDREVAFIAMEYVEGTGLRDYLGRQAAFDPRQVVSIMKQLLLALGFAHARGVIHRDVKPTNVILTADGFLKLADFGISQVDSLHLTVSGTVLGTPSYMSPEQIQGRTIDGRSDLFSAGVVLYELLTGERPFVGSLATVAYKTCHEDPVPPSRLTRPHLPPRIDAVVARALAKAPEARFQTAAEFSDALEEAFETPSEVEETLGPPVPGLPPEKAPPPLPPFWDESVLRGVEARLARIVGPVARVMVRRAASRARDLAGLHEILSEALSDPSERRRFLEAARAAGAGAGPPAVPPPAAGGPGAPPPARPEGSDGTAAPLDQQFADQAAAALAVYLGPVASWVVKRAVKQAESRPDLVRILADQLGAQERRAFLRDLGFRDP